MTFFIKQKKLFIYICSFTSRVRVPRFLLMRLWIESYSVSNFNFDYYLENKNPLSFIIGVQHDKYTDMAQQK